MGCGVSTRRRSHEGTRRSERIRARQGGAKEAASTKTSSRSNKPLTDRQRRRNRRFKQRDELWNAGWLWLVSGCGSICSWEFGEDVCYSGEGFGVPGFWRLRGLFWLILLRDGMRWVGLFWCWILSMLYITLSSWKWSKRVAPPYVSIGSEFM